MTVIISRYITNSLTLQHIDLMILHIVIWMNWYAKFPQEEVRLCFIALGFMSYG